jgi:hypothetical protein
MPLCLDESTLKAALAPILDVPEFRRGLANMIADPVCFSVFLMGVREGELLGERAVATLRQREIASLLDGLRQQELEEHGHGESAGMIARELFPETFDAAGAYRYPQASSGMPYYLHVREANRERLKALGRYTPLNLYLTTTFGYEIMVDLFYRAVIAAVRASALPPKARDRADLVLSMILAQEETHLGLVEQHKALLEVDASALSGEARTMLAALAALDDEDYAWVAVLAVRTVVPTVTRFLDVAEFRAELDAGGGTLCLDPVATRPPC